MLLFERNYESSPALFDSAASAMTTNRSNTFANPSRPTAAFCWNRFKEKSSTKLPQRDIILPAEIAACWVNCVLMPTVNTHNQINACFKVHLLFLVLRVHLVNDCFFHRQQVGHGQVNTSHSQGLGFGVNHRDFTDVLNSARP